MSKIFLTLIALICLISAVSGAEIIIANESGNTWVEWQWQYETPKDIYIDGKLVAENTTTEQWILTDINPEEKHSIKLVDGENIGYSETTTLSLTPFKLTTGILIAIALILIIVGGLTGGWIFTLMAVFPATIALYEYLTYYTDPLMMVFVGFVWVASFGIGVKQYADRGV